VAAVRELVDRPLVPVQSEPGDDDGDVLWDVPTEASASALYAWLAGEAGIVTALRRQLVRGLGLDRESVAFMGYWRAGRSGD
jgi:NADPH-dependent ferric siderophore reductase